MRFLKNLFAKKNQREAVKDPETVQKDKALKSESLRTEPTSQSLEDISKDMKNIDPATSEHIKPTHQKRQMAQPDKEIIERIAKEKERAEQESEAPVKLYHIKKHERGWQVIAEDTDRAYRVFDTQKEAIDFAKEENLEYLLFRVDGTLRQ